MTCTFLLVRFVNAGRDKPPHPNATETRHSKREKQTRKLKMGPSEMQILRVRLERRRRLEKWTDYLRALIRDLCYLLLLRPLIYKQI
jgi:hypothetical protein